jgi:nucleoside-triphosphatase THEP1
MMAGKNDVIHVTHTRPGLLVIRKDADTLIKLEPNKRNDVPADVWSWLRTHPHTAGAGLQGSVPA